MLRLTSKLRPRGRLLVEKHASEQSGQQIRSEGLVIGNQKPETRIATRL